jgi:hypothetical protein
VPTIKKNIYLDDRPEWKSQAELFKVRKRYHEKANVFLKAAIRNRARSPKTDKCLQEIPGRSYWNEKKRKGSWNKHKHYKNYKHSKLYSWFSLKAYRKVGRGFTKKEAQSNIAARADQ